MTLKFCYEQSLVVECVEVIVVSLEEALFQYFELSLTLALVGPCYVIDIGGSLTCMPIPSSHNY